MKNWGAIWRIMRATYYAGSYHGKNVLGIEMVRGRGFAPAEGRIGAPQPVVVLGYHTWMNQFGGDSELVGKNIRVGPAMLQVVGIAPKEFGGTNAKRTELWLPFAAMPLLRPTDKAVHAFLTDPNECCVPIAARLGPGVDRERASAELNVLDRQFTTEYKQKDRSRSSSRGISTG